MDRTPFDYVKSISNSKYYIDDIEENDKSYNAYVINRLFSNNNDTLFVSNEMNINYHIPKDMQYDYYFFSVRKKNRFIKYLKNNSVEEDIKLIMEFYKYNYSKAKEVYKLFTKEHLECIKKQQEKGGFNDRHNDRNQIEK